ncbi:MAG: hypothetical protein QHH75_09540 [Bacillota bacterium]|nr:hypothetical protein [Bacillota bacterium]
MTDNNKLWESHRILLPEVREIIVSRCGECRFFVQIQGQEEIRCGCVVTIKRYRRLHQRVPGRVHVMELLKLAGKSGLQKILEHGDPEERACGMFLPRLQPPQKAGTSPSKFRKSP